MKLNEFFCNIENVVFVAGVSRYVGKHSISSILDFQCIYFISLFRSRITNIETQAGAVMRSTEEGRNAECQCVVKMMNNFKGYFNYININGTIETQIKRKYKTERFNSN